MSPATFRIVIAINTVPSTTLGLSSMMVGHIGVTDMINVGGYVQLHEGDVVELFADSDQCANWTVSVPSSWSMLMMSEL